MKCVELTFDDFLNYKTEWADALQRSGDNHVFLTWEWLSTWWKHFGGERALRLTAVSHDEKLIGAAPLMSSKYSLAGVRLRKVEFIGSPSADYQTFLLVDKKPECASLMVEYARSQGSSWDCMEFAEIPEDSETIGLLRGCLGEKLKFEERTVNICPFITLPSKFEEYFQGLGSNWRRNMRRWEKHLKSEFKVDYVVQKNIDELKGSMATFFDLHQKKWASEKCPGVFFQNEIRDFHQEVARSFAEKGWLNLTFLTLNDKPVSAIYGFKYRNKIFNYLTGYDPEYSEYHVGHLLFLYSIRSSIEAGMKEFDFMRGNESYKQQWNTQVRRNLEVRVIKRRLVPVVYAFLKNEPVLTPLANRLGKRLSLIKNSALNYT